MNDERIEGKKKVLLSSLPLLLPFSIVTLHSAPLNRNRHSQAEGWKKEKGSRSSLLPLLLRRKTRFFVSPIKHSTSMVDLICFWLIGYFNVCSFPSVLGLKWGWSDG